jgi:transcriptional regulator with XRE-family HTH domain
LVKHDANLSKHDASDAKEMRMLFGQNCKAARIEAGLSQADIAERTGIPQSRVSQIELGKANITLETMMILARVIDRDLLYLLSRR